MEPDPGVRAGAPPALAFLPQEGSAVALPMSLEAIPQDALVLWEYERADLYRRLFALVIGNKLKLVKVSVGHENTIEILAEAAITDERAVLRPHFLRRDALVFWASPGPPGSGPARTLVLRVGDRLKMLRVHVDEFRPRIELLHEIDTGG